MKTEEKINRRQFLKQGLFWGLLAVVLPLWSRAPRKPSENKVRPAKARHWRELAG